MRHSWGSACPCRITALVVDQASRKPTCPAADMLATGILEEIVQAPFDS